jgi:glyoxylase-like metal-dependent hydrolase (beta-lactamase superfamily II)
MYIASSLGESLVKVNEGDVIETELWPLQIYHTPGHTEGGMCLYNSDKKILISGDTVFADGLYGAYYGESGSLQAMINSLKKLMELDIDILLPGHGSPVFLDAMEHIMKAYKKASRPR